MKLTSQNSLPYSFVPLKPFQPPTIFFCSQHTEKTPKKKKEMSRMARLYMYGKDVLSGIKKVLLRGHFNN